MAAALMKDVSSRETIRKWNRWIELSLNACALTFSRRGGCRVRADFAHTCAGDFGVENCTLSLE